jgi:hypothetical protein
MTFLTPLAGLSVLAALLVVGAAMYAHRRSDIARRVLRLPAPGRRLLQPALATAGVALLGLAAAQPALTRTSRNEVRRDVQAVFVLDISRSMAASASPTSPTRLDRAVADAVRLRAAIPEVEAGVLTLTDRVLPDLLPVADRPGFDGVVERAVRIESPPPRSSGVRATSYDALAGIASGNVFPPTAKRRIVVLLSDGESNTVQTGDVARALAGYRFAAVHVWRDDESVYDADGKAEPGYRPDPTSGTTLDDLATALGGRSFDESDTGAAASYLRSLVGSGPTVHTAGSQRSRRTLAPYIALAGLVLLLASLTSPSLLRPQRIRLSEQ